MSSDSPVLKPRQATILELAQKKGFVSIDELTQTFNVTQQTIRRDINELCESGQLRRYHGGASPSSTVENKDYATRQILCLEEKRRIARAVAQVIPDHASLLINIGTTNEEVAKALCQHKGLHVITNNLNVASIMSSNPGFEVVIAGGIVRPRDRGIIGEATIEFIRQFKVDFGIIGISGIDEDGQLLDFDYREVQVARAIIDNARQVFLVADHTKFGRNAMVRLCHMSRIHALFTDKQPPTAISTILAESGGALYIAPAGS
ncbi:DeoR/GlpR family DNA-binding transcription regulator [Beijerinckia indica]|uniref:Transcriptional regulator, DeoR family n=1 Tax=Beijerinckia indica subsp. indica (strain ATCC 9039 / DSM 1715 / NCIMB 8712) TaxID=395963 RepID=B2IE06_BEII9|nr:DeoR family transcriptional regulator [Beijerinckia indica]ACB94030.1 transcriptional regulator, DeoR family [Beijerinckia indica subsp. indica ATCC 9039]